MILRRGLLCGLALAASLGSAHAQPATLAGTWSGVIVDGETKLRLRLKIDEAGKAQLESLDQMPDFFFPGEVEAADGQVTMTFPTLSAEFKGRLTETERLEGRWRQVGEFPLVLMRGERDAPTEPARARCRSPRC